MYHHCICAIIPLFICHRPFSPWNSVCTAALTLGLSATHSLPRSRGDLGGIHSYIYSGDHPNRPREVHSHKPHRTFAHSRNAFFGLHTFYCKSIAQDVPIPFQRLQDGKYSVFTDTPLDVNNYQLINRPSLHLLYHLPLLKLIITIPLTHFIHTSFALLISLYGILWFPHLIILNRSQDHPPLPRLQA